MKYRNTSFVPSVRIATLVFLSLCGTDLSPARAATEGARVVKYSKEDIIPIRAKLRFSTLIILPDNEEIIDFTTGDKDFWIIDGAHNLCYIHPAEAGLRTNLNLITASGHVYSFLLSEISNEPNAEPDLKIFVEPKDDSIAGASSLRSYVRADEVDAYKVEIDTIRAQAEDHVRAAQAQAAEQIDKFRADYQPKLRFDYRLNSKASGEPFRVSAIYHDDAFTYIECAAHEKPALYEVKDGKPNLINFQVENGVYIVPKILDRAYLAIGKRKLVFSRQAAN